MNKKQRMQNRSTAKILDMQAGWCPECGKQGKHWMSYPYTLANMIAGLPQGGFWTCDKFYGKDGRRLEDSEDYALNA
jgi:hypothetical protein